MKRINEKIGEIKGFLAELENIAPSGLEEYKTNNLVRAACERYVEKIIEGITDIAFLLIKYKKFEIPENDIDAFRILFKHKIISEESYLKLKQAKGMRNIIAHEYGKIDDEIVYHSIKEELNDDILKFFNMIKRNLK